MNCYFGVVFSGCRIILEKKKGRGKGIEREKYRERNLERLLTDYLFPFALGGYKLTKIIGPQLGTFT